MKAVCIIPARMASSRFPGKPLTPILGKPMIQWVWERCKRSTAVDEVYIATCDVVIRQTAIDFGAAVIMTNAEHKRATERVAEAASKVAEFEIIVMVQGDEPLVHPEMIQSVMTFMTRSVSWDGCVNLVALLQPEEVRDPDTVKVVCDYDDYAWCMTRAPIATKYKQVCVIGFSKQRLLKYAELPPSPFEIAESIDMLRFIEAEFAVSTRLTHYRTHAVDRPEDVPIVEEMLRLESRTD